ncbi:1-deoxy-D-xylulose-5-phosphate reductoisomerase [Methylotenera sp. 1P/1]|uniref:1-deoxy-D-xylulose-5-phosphate reductoisomerase n=1 Tax=Methylotenera sp. 1P/1 TaxID=1131551 RepID=UPI00035E7C0A|nr:1-deoxy-D-xylulose-5-phosphate reductoisomerase [Methylotenera sp. 1P/1]
MQNVTILGSTGTIGQQTLDVIARHPARFNAFALAANNNVDSLFKQCLQFKPRYAVLLEEQAAHQLTQRLREANSLTEVLLGMQGLEFVASCDDVQVVMAAIVGAAGLKPAMAAANAGKRILLANKETLVMAGSLFMQAVKQGGATLLPIDSEHNAIFQVMPPVSHAHLQEGGVRKVILTASGGPFRNYSQAQLKQVTTELALKHPNWVMGAKITIDSATLMNKGLEVIEAHWLFNAQPEQIEVVVHPQSVIHSMVEYVDGSVLAQLGNPDMRTPIAYALGYPERIEAGVKSLNLIEIAQLQFEKPDMERFPCLRLAYDALKLGGTASTILNAANEIAVAAFLQKSLHFLELPQLISDALMAIPTEAVSSLEQLIEVDARARAYARNWLANHANVEVLSA